MDPLELQQQLVDQRRGRYVRVSDVDRRQLIDTYKKGDDFIALAKKLNIKRSTARSILRTFIDEGRVSAKQRAGTRLRFITEDEAEIIREMKRRHPLITIGQIQMRLQRTSNRVLSKASISRILTNSIRLGKRAKRSVDGEDDGQDGLNETMENGHDELVQLSSDEGTGGAFYIDDDEEDDDDDDDDDDDAATIGVAEKTSSLQNLDDFQRFMLRKTSVNGDESTVLESLDENVAAAATRPNDHALRYPNYGSEEDEDELSEMDDHGTESSPNNGQPEQSHKAAMHSNGDTAVLNENSSWNLNPTSIKSEPVCVFVNRTYDSSDSEQLPTPMDDKPAKATLNSQSTAHRRIKICPICGEKNFSRLSHHLTVAHNLNREESLTLLAHTDRNPSATHHSLIAAVSSSSPKNASSNNHWDRSPQQTPISINTNNQQITSASSSPPASLLPPPPPTPLPTTDSDSHHLTVASHFTSNDQPTSNYSSVDGKKRLLCPRCDTWVLNLTDHLIKKHHLLSKQERLPFLRLARNRSGTGGADKTSGNAFLISPSQANPSNDQQQAVSNRKYQNIIKKYRKKILDQTQPSSSSHHPILPLASHEISSNSSNATLLTMNNIQSLLNNSVQQEKFALTTPRTFTAIKTNGSLASANKDSAQFAIHQKFEQRLTVFRQQFAVTVAMQNSLMQQMELLQHSFVSIEDEWSDMRKEIVSSVS